MPVCLSSSSRSRKSSRLRIPSPETAPTLLTIGWHHLSMTTHWSLLFPPFFHPDWCICMLLGGFPPPCRLDRFLSVPRPHSFPTSSLFTQEHDCLRTTFIECIIWLYPSNICLLSAGGLHTRYNMCFKDPVESNFPQILLFVFEFIRNSLLAFRLIRERVAWCFHLNWLSFRNCSLIWV